MDIRKFFTRTAFGLSSLNKDETLSVCQFISFEHLCALKSVNRAFHYDSELKGMAIFTQDHEVELSPEIIKIGMRVQHWTYNGDDYDNYGHGTVFNVKLNCVNEDGENIAAYSIAWDEQDGVRKWNIRCSDEAIQRLVKYDHW